MVARPTREEWPFWVAVVGAVVAAYFSSSFFHPDEHFQTLEFAGVKLGRLRADQTVQEYGLRMRTWLLPGLQFLLVRAAEFVGVADPFHQAVGVRLAHAAAFLSATSALMRATLGKETWRRSAVWLFAFVPYFAVRTSSENASAALLAWGVVAAERALRARGAMRALWAGLLFGLAFEVRYQVLFVVLGYAASVLLRRLPVAASQWASVLAGFLVALGIGALCNRWGYGSWEFPLHAYYVQNVKHGMADSYGREPWFAFAYLPLGNVCVAAALLCMLSALAHVRRTPTSPLSGALIAGVLGQSVFAHKEERFLFPMIPFAMAASATVLPSWWRALRGASARSLAWRVGLWAPCGTLLLLNSVAWLVLAFFPLNWRGSVRAMHAVYNAQAQGPVRVVDATEHGVWQMRFYTNPPWTRSRGDVLGCNNPQRTLVLFDALAPLPAVEAGCTWKPRMTELGMLAPVVSAATLERMARALPGAPLPRFQWHAAAELVKESAQEE